MFRIRKIHDTVSVINKSAVAQVQEIIRSQFPTARSRDLEKIPLQLHDPVHFQYRSVLFVADDNRGRVRGFAVLLHMVDIGVTCLELISTAPRVTSRGVGGVLYERVRDESIKLGARGLFFECSVDDPDVVQDAEELKQNRSRLRFYERYGVYPVDRNAYDSPILPGDTDLYYLMYDPLKAGRPLPLELVRATARAILVRKYGDIMHPEQIDEVVSSFRDDPACLRLPRYAAKPAVVRPAAQAGIGLVVNEKHSIHHVADRGYLEAPIRLPQILRELDRSGLFCRIEPRSTPAGLLQRIHDPEYLSFMREVARLLPADKSIYPSVFPGRSRFRRSRDLEVQIGCFCTDTMTPLSGNAYLAARGAVDCAVTAASLLVEDYGLAYALVRPPGHHAEWSKFGGFCYFNSTAAAAEYLSDYGRVGVLDVDFHHGNGTQDIFYERADVLTVSIHGDPTTAYPYFTGYVNETGRGAGTGFNCNLPLPVQCSTSDYHGALKKALKRIRGFAPDYLVVALGLDPAKADPTGTWSLLAADFEENGRMIGALGLPTVVVQEGGYRTRTLGANARHFFVGLAAAHGRATSGADGKAVRTSGS